MAMLLGIIANLVMLVLAFKVWRWSRKQAKSGRTTWRRRVGLTFLLAPILLWVLEALSVPDVVLLPLRAIDRVNDGIDAALGALIGLTKENLTGLWAAALKPLCYAVVYGSLGVLIGWPLDRWKAKREAAKAAAAGQPPPTSNEGAGQSDPSSSAPSSPA